MDLHVVLVSGAALICGVLIWLSATTATGRGARRWILILALAQIALFYVATADLLGRPKPVSVEFVSARLERAEVIAHHLQQDEAIFVWLQPEIGEPPVSYRLPWSEQTARDLHEAARQVEQRGGTVQLSVPVEGGAEGGEPSIGWVPPVAPPPKQR
ncbi:MAG TPA: hypothetical protein VIR38_00135 [Thalassobaculum sp.]